jgi:hypothetical protein
MPAVDFGDPGITVTTTTVNGDDNLTLSLAIAATAKFGAHDVTITSGSTTIKLTGAFTVNPELQGAQQAMPVSGAQGGLVPLVLLNQDYVQNPLSQTFGQPQLGGAVSSPVNLGATIAAARLTANGLIDPLASVAPLAVQVLGYDVFGQPLTYYTNPSDANLPTVTARTPTVLTLGTPLTSENFAAPLSTNLYSFSTTATNQIMYAQFSNLGMELPDINAALAPNTGKFSDGQPLDSPGPFVDAAGNTVIASLALLPVANTYYLSTYSTDFSGDTSGGYDNDVLVTALPGTSFSAKEPATPDSGTMPLATLTNLAASSASYAVDGAADYAGDVDYIRYNILG